MKEAAATRAAPPAGGRFARLTPLDLSYLRVESPAWPCHYGGVAILEGRALLDDSGRLRLDEVRHRLSRRLGRAPQLRRRLYVPGPMRGRPLWVDDDRFAIEHHVHEAEVPSPGDDTRLQETATRIYERLLDRRRPLWELWFLTGLPDGRVGALLKLHHAVADGLAAVTLMGGFLDFAADAPDPAEASWAPVPTPGAWALLADNVSGRARAAGHRVVLLAHPRRVVAAARLVARILRRSLGPGKGPRLSLNRRVEAGRVVRFLRLDLAAMKAAAHSHDGKLNDIVLALWSGGLRDLLLSRGEAIPGGEVTTGLAVSLRSNSDPAAGNLLGMMAVPLPVAEADARHRLDLVIRATRRVKNEQDADAIARTLVAWAATPVARRATLHQHAIHVFATNLMGPTTPLYVLGARILDVFPIGDLKGNVGLLLAALSYDGRVFLAVTADAVAFPDVDVVVGGMERDWEALAAGR
ncbi:MAG: DUF1298 domain-containing protein [Acidimicrobiia bacterium]|nr:DUF1298 domain-containing protein [Acidimicrobiia bacterium]